MDGLAYLSDLIKRVLHITDVYVFEQHPESRTKDTEAIENSTVKDEGSTLQYPSAHSSHVYACKEPKLYLSSAQPLTYQQRIQANELVSEFYHQKKQYQVVQEKNEQLFRLVEFSARLLDGGLDQSSNFERLFGFIKDYGHYAIFRNDEELVNTGVKKQQAESTLLHLQKKSTVQVRSNYGTTTGFKENEFFFILLTYASPDDILLSMIRSSIKVLEASERAHERLRQLRTIEEHFSTDQDNKEAGVSQGELQRKYEILKQQFEETLELAITDSLTKCYNRRKMEQMLEEQAENCHRKKGRFCLIMIDVDHFKRVNDTYGHDAGDRVLVGLTRLLNMHLRDADEISRWGGEEFIVILPHTELQAAKKLCERLRKIIEDHDFDIPQKVTASFGVCEFDPNGSIDDLLKDVDNALYQAKTNGRNQVVCVQLSEDN